VNVAEPGSTSSGWLTAPNETGAVDCAGPSTETFSVAGAPPGTAWTNLTDADAKAAPADTRSSIETRPTAQPKTIQLRLSGIGSRF
jgi:hypothetical protein